MVEQIPRCMDFTDDVLSICLACGYMPGAFIPGMECPQCGETIL